MTEPVLSLDTPASLSARHVALAASRLEVLDHAVRTPLGTLASTFEVVRLATDPETTRQAVTIMERQVRQVMTQLGELRDIARLLRGLESGATLTGV